MTKSVSKKSRKPKKSVKRSVKSIKKSPRKSKSIKKSVKSTRKSKSVKKSPRKSKNIKKSPRKSKSVKKSPRKSKSVKKSVKIISRKSRKSVENGIYIDGVTISSISGPVSFYYLRPKASVYKNGNAYYFPLIILFGDAHRSYQNMCSNCVCVDKICCYKLSDTALLQKFDTLSSKEHPVDFYTETSFAGTGEGFSRGMMEYFTTGDMVSCYHRRFKNTSRDKCPTKNIRWQAGDVRTAGISVTMLAGDDYDQDYVDTSKKFKEDKYIESQLYYLMRLTNDIEADSQYSEYSAKESSVFKNMDEFKKLLSSIIDDDGKHYNTKRFARTLFGMMNSDNSAIYKQIQKQTFEKFNDINLWADFYASSIDNELKIDPIVLKKLIDEVDFTGGGYFYFLSHGDRKLLNEFGVSLRTSLLDVYVMARIFKQPTGGKRSSLSFCYFGDDHIENIQRLLLKTGFYESVIEQRKPVIDYSKVSRCQQFNFSLNLTKEVNKHNKAIDKL